MFKWGPFHGNLPNRAKTILFVKPQFHDALTIFQGTGIQNSMEGCDYLGGVVGTDAFVKKIAEEKVALVYGGKRLNVLPTLLVVISMMLMLLLLVEPFSLCYEFYTRILERLSSAT